MSQRPDLGPRGENLSILVPTYNCAALLRQALESLKAQGETIAAAQIEVIDDVSTKDDPEAVVNAVWPGRVSFYRHPKNIGPCANFNACIERAQRPWVHILHGDDYLLPGAYTAFGKLIQENPTCRAAFGRVLFVDADGVWKNVSPLLGGGKSGPWAYHPLEWRNCPVQFAGALFSRELANEVGGFDCHFSHAQDWNLWWRMVKTGTATCTTDVVACYRVFEGNHTSGLVRTGRNIGEYLDQLARLEAETAKTHPQIPRATLYEPVFISYAQQCLRLRGDAEAWKANWAYLSRFPSAARVPSLLAKLYLSRLGIRK